MSGLEYLLRPSGGEDVLDADIFTTYRAMGCQSFTRWEVGIHRVVQGVRAEVERMAEGLRLDDDNQAIIPKTSQTCMTTGGDDGGVEQ